VSNNLTIKQEKFVLKYFKCGNASEAYRHAYKTQNMKNSTVWEKSSLLLKDGKVRTRLKDLQTQAAIEAEWNVQKLITAHANIYSIAIGKKAAPRIIIEHTGGGSAKTFEMNMHNTDLKSAIQSLIEIGKLIGAYDKGTRQQDDDNGFSMATFAKEFYDEKQAEKLQNNKVINLDI